MKRQRKKFINVKWSITPPTTPFVSFVKSVGDTDKSISAMVEEHRVEEVKKLLWRLAELNKI